MTRSTLALAGLLLLAACKGGDEKQPVAAVSGSAAAGSAAAGSAAAGSAGAAAAVAEATGSAGSASGSAAAGPPPLGPKIKAARCGEPCLFLTDTPLDKLLETYKAECGGMATKDLGYKDCKSLDYARNCIYAAHGLVYKKKKWKVFSTKPWYEAHPEFKATSISPLEIANVSELNKRGKACKAGINISGADFERLKQWAAAVNAGKIPPAKAYFVDNERKKAADVAASLKETLTADGTKSKLTFESGASGAYEKWADVPDDLVKAIKVPASAKPRSILIDISDPTSSATEENPITEGIVLRFIYDDKDQLLAVGVAHYLND